MDSLGKIIAKRLNQHKLGESATASLILHKTDALLAEQFDCDEFEMKALRVKEGILTIGTASSVWSQELWAFQEELIAHIRKAYGEKSVFKILIKGLTTD